MLLACYLPKRPHVNHCSLSTQKQLTVQGTMTSTADNAFLSQIEGPAPRPANLLAAEAGAAQAMIGISPLIPDTQQPTQVHKTHTANLATDQKLKGTPPGTKYQPARESAEARDCIPAIRSPGMEQACRMLQQDAMGWGLPALPTTAGKSCLGARQYSASPPTLHIQL